MTEFLYLVDKSDKVLGKIERNEAHQRKFLHRAGVVLVFNSNEEVCLAKRSLKKNIFPGVIDSVCSFHVKYGQSYEEAARAELFEETGINKIPKHLGKFVMDEDPDHMIVAVFQVTYNDTLKLDPLETDEYKFYNFQKADSIINHEKITSWLSQAWKIYKKTMNKISK